MLDGEGTRETFTLTASGAAGAEYAFERLVFTRSLTRGLSFTAANANPILTAVDCDFIANGADGTINGRGLYLKNGGDSSLSNCTFQGNVCRSCSGNSAGSGFGAYFEGNDNRVFIDNCQFLTNGYVDVGYTKAIDAGDPDGDYSMEPRPNGERLNLGAYGNTPEAALSPKGLVIFVQ